MPSTTQTKYWVDASGDLAFLHARYVTHRFAPHTHDTYSLGVILHGALAFDHQRQHHRAPAGTISVINPGEVHTGYAGIDGGWEYRNFFISPALMRRAARQILGMDILPDFPQPTIDDPALMQRLADLHCILEQSSVRLEREGGMLWTLALLLHRHATTTPPDAGAPSHRPGIAQACTVMHECYADDLSLELLAETAGLSPYHFLRVFRKETGLTPHRYLIQVRVERARRLLNDGYPIAQAALATGFSDQSHLTRRFKEILGVAPGHYQRSRNIVQDRRCSDA